MFTVYVLKSDVSRRYYIGYSGDLEKRILQHNSGLVRSTKAYQPYKIIYTEEYDSRSKALKREKELKKMKSNHTFKKLVDKTYMPG